MKKKILFTILLGTCAVPVFAGGNDAPPAVKAKFVSLYPRAVKIKWEKEKANYEASFRIQRTEMSCLFDSTGSVLETESEIEIAALPKAAAAYIAKNYAGQKIKEAARITTTQNVTTYEAEVKEGDLVFDSNGIFIKKIVE